MSAPHTLSPATRWLSGFLASRVFQAAVLAAVVVAAALYLTGVLSEGPAAALLALLVAIALALSMIRPALAGAIDPTSRGVAVAIAAATGLLSALSAVTSVVPGAPLLHAEVSRVGDRLELPAGAQAPAHQLRLLVHAPLPPGGTPVVEFRFTGGAGPLAGQVERTVSYARVGRGNRAAVAHDHNQVWVHGSVGAGATALTLDRLDGPISGPLLISVYGDWISPPMLWLLSLALLILAAIWEVRLGGGSFAALAGMALAYGLLVHGNATPDAAIGTSLGALMLGALVGALAGGLLAKVAGLGPWGRAAPTEAPRATGRERQG